MSYLRAVQDSPPGSTLINAARYANCMRPHASTLSPKTCMPCQIMVYLAGSLKIPGSPALAKAYLQAKLQCSHCSLGSSATGLSASSPPLT